MNFKPFGKMTKLYKFGKEINRMQFRSTCRVYLKIMFLRFDKINLTKGLKAKSPSLFM